jgi:ABC-type transporter Mla maintaining outer membrane lipid asymmetry permease subunit MlaE
MTKFGAESWFGVVSLSLMKLHQLVIAHFNLQEEIASAIGAEIGSMKLLHCRCCTATGLESF